ncbi:MAG TPA: chitobiase/beta-hexosaminidase C-terminal domain-containing protein [Methylomirabilota bacterium]|nr:chitobiase/beta-hexosaminidase C-terminal domain-containing protein [Methylomirabilota bacterium]
MAVPRSELLAPDPDGRTARGSMRFADGRMLYFENYSGGGGLIPRPPNLSIRVLNVQAEVEWAHQAAESFETVRIEESIDFGVLWVKLSSVTWFDSNGVVRWTTPVDPAFPSAPAPSIPPRRINPPPSVNQGLDGSVWLAGMSSGKVRVQKILANGTLSWSQAIEVAPTTLNMRGHADGSALFYGTSASNTDVVAFSANGEKQWQKDFPIVVYDALKTDDGWLLGHTHASPTPGVPVAEPSRGAEDIRILKINSAGEPLREISLGGSGIDTFRRFKTNRLGQWFVLGTSTSDSGPAKESPRPRSGEGSWLLKLDASLKRVWDYTFSAVAMDKTDYRHDLRAHLINDADGGFIYTEQSAFTFPYHVEVTRLSDRGELSAYSQVTVPQSLFPSSSTGSAERTITVPLRGSHGDVVAALTSQGTTVKPGSPVVTWADEFGPDQTQWKAIVKIESSIPTARIYYSTDGSIPSANSHRYTEPFPLSAAANVHAIAIADATHVLGTPKPVFERVAIKIEQQGTSLLITSPKRARYQIEHWNRLASDWEPIGRSREDVQFEIFPSEKSAFFRLHQVE